MIFVHMLRVSLLTGIDSTVPCPVGWPFGNPWAPIADNGDEVVDNLANNNSDNENDENGGTVGDGIFTNHFVIQLQQSVVDSHYHGLLPTMASDQWIVACSLVFHSFVCCNPVVDIVCGV